MADDRRYRWLLRWERFKLAVSENWLRLRGVRGDSPRLYRIGEDVPDVGECYGHQRERQHGNTLASCPQCDGSHDHAWVVCVLPERSYVGRAVPIRCRICGGRKCDNEGCTQRRHHSEPHLYSDGTIRKVGA